MNSRGARTPAEAGPGPAVASRAIPSAHVALLDRDGVVVSVNRAWRHFGLSNGGSATTGLGRNYLEVCEHAATHGERIGADVAALVRAALDGLDTGKRVTYRCGLGQDQRRFSVYAVPLPGRHRGALVVHVDVTLERLVEVITGADDA